MGSPFLTSATVDDTPITCSDKLLTNKKEPVYALRRSGRQDLVRFDLYYRVSSPFFKGRYRSRGTVGHAARGLAGAGFWCHGAGRWAEHCRGLQGALGSLDTGRLPDTSHIHDACVLEVAGSGARAHAASDVCEKFVDVGGGADDCVLRLRTF